MPKFRLCAFSAAHATFFVKIRGPTNTPDRVAALVAVVAVEFSDLLGEVLTEE